MDESINSDPTDITTADVLVDEHDFTDEFIGRAQALSELAASFSNPEGPTAEVKHHEAKALLELMLSELGELTKDHEGLERERALELEREVEKQQEIEKEKELEKEREAELDKERELAKECVKIFQDESAGLEHQVKILEKKIRDYDKQACEQCGYKKGDTIKKLVEQESVYQTQLEQVKTPNKTAQMRSLEEKMAEMLECVKSRDDKGLSEARKWLSENSEN